MPYPSHAHLLPREIHNGLSTISLGLGDNGSISESKIRIPRPIPVSAALLTRADEVVRYRELAHGVALGRLHLYQPAACLSQRNVNLLFSKGGHRSVP
jgi:hypothetical protein